MGWPRQSAEHVLGSAAGVALVGLLVVLSTAGCRPEEVPDSEGTGADSARPAPCVDVEPATVATVHDEISVRANLIAHRSSLVMSRRTGYVAEITTREGEPVIGGQTVLMTLRAEELSLAVGAARAGVEMARAGVSQSELQRASAETDLGRAEALHDRGAVTTEQRDRAQSMVDLMDEGVRRAEAQLRLAQNTVRQALELEEDTEVVAPIDGVVLRRLVEVGELVSAFPPTPLFQLIDPSEIRVQAHIPERYAERVELGQAVRIQLADGRERLGQIDYVAPGLDVMARTLEVRVLLDNAAGELRHGLSAWMRIELGQGERTFLPRHVLRRVVGDRGYLFALNADGRTVRELTVRLGALQDDGYPVLEGLDAGTPIVTRGWDALSEGSAVRVATDGSCQASSEPP